MTTTIRQEKCRTCYGEAVVSPDGEHFMPCPNAWCDDGWVDVRVRAPVATGWLTLLLTGFIGFLLILAAVWWFSTSRPRPDSTATPALMAPVAAPGDVSPARGASGRASSGAPTNATGGRPITAPQPLGLGAPLPAQGAASSVAYGKASWCAPTPRYCHGWGGRSILAASPNWAGQPYWAKVCRQDRPTWCATVYVHSYCACGSGKVVDVTPHVFSDRWKVAGRWQGLGVPLGRGTVEVVVTKGSGPRLPPTDTAPTP